jgi:DNA modification methylase
MGNRKASFETEQELQAAILQEKAKGTPDIEIGKKYGVTYRYIERLITKTQGLNISRLRPIKKMKRLHPKDFRQEYTTVWSFKQRGNWATHSGEYRGNWSPYIPRNVILKYSRPGELVLDYFCGAGTTAVECKLLGRKCIAFDINGKAIELARKNIDFDMEWQQLTFIEERGYSEECEARLFVGDARDLSFLDDNSIDLICAHPPYANIIHYTDSKKGDLSFFDIDDYLSEMEKVAKESYRVLKAGRQCAILIGDTRRKKHVVPLGFKLIDVYLNAGFKLRELVIKRQHNCKTTGFWYANSIKYNFLLLAHEYLPIFEKPKSSVAMKVKEREADYDLVVPDLRKLPWNNKLDEIETTTVWILPENEFEDRLDRNVIDRYTNGDPYSIIAFVSHSRNSKSSIAKRAEMKRGLLFIKAPFLNINPSHSNVENYLKETKEIVNQRLSTISNDGFIVIQTQDVRIDGFVEYVAKRLVDMLILDNLWLKEIIVVTQEGANSKNKNSGDYLKISHQYLLVYEVKR